MAQIFLAVFLIVFGLNILTGVTLPPWVIGLLALIAGILIVTDRFRIRMDRK
jgi:uncharacterized membrane protein HdeD (DUF308 family)